MKELNFKNIFRLSPLNKEELADLMGFSTQTARKLIQGKVKNLTVNIAKKICEGFSIPKDLFFEANKKYMSGEARKQFSFYLSAEKIIEKQKTEENKVSDTEVVFIPGGKGHIAPTLFTKQNFKLLDKIHNNQFIGEKPKNKIVEKQLKSKF